MFLKNRTILQKITALTTLSFLCIVLISYVGFKLIISSLSQEMSDTYRENLKLYANLLESETQKVNTLGLNLVTNSSVQNILDYFSNSKNTDPYTNLVKSKDLSDILFRSIGYSGYISHIDILANNNKTISSSEMSYLSSQPNMDEIIAKAKGSNTGPFWCKASKPNCIFEVREIRSANGDNIDQPIGILFIWVDLKQMIHHADANGFFDRNLFFIADGDDVLFTNSSVDFSALEENKAQKNAKIAGTDYIVSDIVSQQNKWDYYILCPVESVFGPIHSIVNSVVAVSLTVFILIVLGCYLLSKQIISPLSALARQMKIVETGNFDIEKEGLLKKAGNDEIGSLCKDFVVMAQKINSLITINYKNKLVLQETKLKALQAQINPHFLYNVLDTINWCGKMGKSSEISILIENLSVLLRGAINAKTIYHTIRKELVLVDSYISIQTVRYGEKLKFYSDIEPELLDCMIPKLLFQPIIENSILYGLESTGKTCSITLSVQPEGESELMVMICDNGPGISQNEIKKILTGELKPKGNGIGLKNIDSRIKIAYGEEYGIEIRSEPGSGTSVLMKMPRKPL
ncbi:MAG: histidine kinase [Oscillospiraceae bacterium]|jgi:two-component system sensor histidine kinase YesM|nr:histidine kinase [Oscillospiraceae bacterium]